MPTVKMPVEIIEDLPEDRADRRTVLTSIGAAVLIHAVVLLAILFSQITVSPPAPPLPLMRLIPVKKIELPPAPEPQKISSVSAAQPEKPTGAERLMPVMDRKELEVSEKFASAPRDKVAKPEPVAVSSELLVFDGREVKSSLIAQKAPRSVSPAPLVTNIPVTDTEPAVPRPSEGGAVVNEEFLEKMPGFTPEQTLGLVDAAIPDNEGQSNVPGVTRKTDFQDLKDMLSYELSTYQDPRDKQKYFKLSLRVNEKTQNFNAIPKEVVFLLDASISIKPERLEQFKTGILQCLDHLNPGDFFNVAIFKEQTTMFRPEPVAATPENIKSLKGFLDWVRAGESTDAFGALKQFINSKRSPSYIIFLSDGWATAGVTDSRQLINEISRDNDGKTAIFAYSGGSVNRYLLDFIAYKNRGWSEYSEREHFIGRNLAAMYGKIRDPLLLNLRYRVSGVADENVFPKMLPDFFRNAEFTLYGLYSDEQELVLQLLGDAEGKTREYLAQVPVSQAVAGEKDIARLWAFNKIYYLISLLQYEKDNTQILKEIEVLSQKFDIKTPYSNELKK